MAALTAAGKILAHRLLDWDRARVAGHEAAGFDVTVYKGRQDMAEICIDADVDSWPSEIRYLFLAVLEVTRSPTPALQHGIGPLRARVRPLSPVDRAAYNALAREIGVIEQLRETSPRLWAEEVV